MQAVGEQKGSIQFPYPLYKWVVTSIQMELFYIQNNQWLNGISEKYCYCRMFCIPEHSTKLVRKKHNYLHPLLISVHLFVYN